MAASSQQSLRKAIGALKDSTKVGLVSLNSDNKEVDLAIVKATNHDEALPKEKHIKTIFDAVSASRPRPDVAYCIQGLSRRLAKTRCWMVALKTLIVVHRALREVDLTFCQELINFSRRSLMLNLSHFRDESSPVAWDYSAWVRTYALYLEERVECFRLLKYDVEKSILKTKGLQTADLLEQLPFLQQLLFRLLGCKPEGAAMYNGLIHYALSIVVSESIKLYVTITDGILNLVDKYFEMQRHDAIRALEIYRKSGAQADSLNELFEICRGLGFGRGQNYVKIEQPPPSFLAAMADYVQQAPHSLALQSTAISGYQGVPAIEAPKVVAAAPESDLLSDKQDTNVKEEADQSVTPEPRSDQGGADLLDLDVKDESTTTPEPRSGQSEVAATHQIFDLLGLDQLNSEASQLEEKNSLALAIIPSGYPTNSGNDFNEACQTLGWELALVTAPSSNGAAVAESKLAGGLDKLTLDSLYDQAMASRANPNVTHNMGAVPSNPFESASCIQDPFYASSSIAPPTIVQMADMLQQQQSFIRQQQQQLLLTGPSETNPSRNPFLDQSLPSQTPQNPFSGLI
ncbi:putative clathrin assembly protein At5g35200 [Pistacia vera]|uniref:putative clathrin assembly protein At5g35200 n=1 Tax=Pistacia vera TaxID=55513 RepID=UPI0012639101|nr:putative clathrin assembly protein At5g35200 [Pistacia vera]